MPSPINRLLDRLELVEQRGDRWRAKCPAHQNEQSRSRSLSIAQGDDGRVLIHCFASCAPADVLGAVGLRLSNLFEDPPAPRGADRRAELLSEREAHDIMVIESQIVAIAAQDIADGKTLSDADALRVARAAGRIVRVRNARRFIRERG